MKIEIYVILGWAGNFDIHHRFEYHRVRVRERLGDRVLGREHEGRGGGVDWMGDSLVEYVLDVHNRILPS